MVVDSFYLSDERNLIKAERLLEMSQDEIVEIVGRFNKSSIRSGQVRGEVIELEDGSYAIRHHFNKKILWRST